MDINLRQAIMLRVTNKNEEELYEIVEESVRSEERALPGLGVLFEIMWENSEDDIRKSLVNTLQKHIPKQEVPAE